MEFVNTTSMAAGYTVGMDADGREFLVLVVKGTFVLPVASDPVQLHPQQEPLVLADTFTGKSGLSAPQHEADYALRKQACDVLLLGSAYAQNGRPAVRVPVMLQVGPMKKEFCVVGDRVWQASLSGIRASSPRPFTRMPLTYDVAFGGMDTESEDPSEHDAYMLNPAGRGFRKHLRAAWVDGRPLPNTEEHGSEVTWPANPYAPMAFGPLGRSWRQRARFAGTYDQQWLDHQFPFLPRDFNDRFHQAAPADQQLPHPTGPLPVMLGNLTDDGLRQFALPSFEASVTIFPKHGEREDVIATLDTLLFEPDHGRFSMSWRVTRPLQRDLFEIAQLVVGRQLPMRGRPVKVQAAAGAAAATAA